MKVLCVARDQLELTCQVIRQPQVLIGRSPACDVVLRAPGLQAVHFLLEWVGEKVLPDAESGCWILTDISRDNKFEGRIKSQGEGKGVVLGDHPVQFAGLIFSWRQDRIRETPLDKKALSHQVTEAVSEAGLQLGQSYGARELLEVIQVDGSTKSVSDVCHLSQRHGLYRPLPVAKSLRVKWVSRQSVHVYLHRAPESQVFSNGEEMALKVQGKRKYVELSVLNMLMVRLKDSDIYLRFVAPAPVKSPQREILHDSFFGLSLGFLVLSSIFVVFILMSPRFEKKRFYKGPPRLARVEVKEVSAPKPPATPVQRPRLAQTVSPRAPMAPQSKPGSEVKKQVRRSARSGTRSRRVRENTKGLNSVAKAKDVNSVGLLGALNRGQSGRVSADMVMDSAVLERSASGESGRVVTKNSPGGAVSDEVLKDSTPDQLARAATTLSVGDDFDQSSRGPIARKKGDLKYQVGAGSDNLDPGSRSADSLQESVRGGLSRSQVLGSLAPRRSEVRACYERALLSNSKLNGQVVYRWHISSQGSVTSIQVLDSKVNFLPLEDCVNDIIQSIRFPQASNGQPTTVVYPFMFKKQ